MIPVLEIVRMENDAIHGMFGMLRINKKLFCAVLEPPDRANAPFRSCIPAGQYLCRRDQSPKFGETFVVTEVPGRSDIKFHAGNTVADTAGCMLLGEYPAKLRGDRQVKNSGATFRAFMEAMALYPTAHLTIYEFF